MSKLEFHYPTESSIVAENIFIVNAVLLVTAMIDHYELTHFLDDIDIVYTSDNGIVHLYDLNTKNFVRRPG
jgi:hypothetical protein